MIHRLLNDYLIDKNNCYINNKSRHWIQVTVSLNKNNNPSNKTQYHVHVHNPHPHQTIHQLTLIPMLIKNKNNTCMNHVIMDSVWTCAQLDPLATMEGYHDITMTIDTKINGWLLTGYTCPMKGPWIEQRLWINHV